MDKYEAEQIAQRTIIEIQNDIRQKKPLFECRLATTDSLPLKLPTGWRCPYDLLLDGVRIQEEPLILFVNNKSGRCEIEYGDESLSAIKDGIYQEREIPTLDAIDASLKEEFGGRNVRIETSERVVAFSDKTANLQPYWRIGLIDDNNDRSSTRMSFSPDNKIQRSELKPKSRYAAQKFPLGRSQFQRSPGNVIIRLKGFPKKQPVLQIQWLFLSCIAHAATYLAKLDYHPINYYDIHTELKPTSSTKSPTSSRVENIPVISFSLNGGWTEDPTIICHELGHAIWEFFFTRPPKHLDLNSAKYLGIQEGFADYFAATLLANKNSDSILIGERILHETITNNRYDDVLPRLIDGNRPEISNTLDPNEKPYGVGKRWANLLWDLRRQIGPEKADAIIFLAHLKPFTGECQSQDPLEAYFESLKQAAVRLRKKFTAWDQLKANHQI